MRPHTHTHTHTHLSTVPELNLDYIVDNPWLVIPISGLRQINIDQVIDWLVKQAR
jgi:Arf/Sar family protein